MLIVPAAILGLLFGSFATMFAYRVPRGLSIMGRSACPNCNATITASENIPVLSYIFLRGKCRHCGNKISLRYPAIELLTGTLFALSAAKFDLTLQAFIYAAFFWVLVVLTVIDLDQQLLPDLIVIPSIAVGWIAIGVLAGVDSNVGHFSGVSMLLAIAFVAAVTALALIPAALTLGRKREPDLDVEQELPPTFDPRRLPAVIAWTALLLFALLDGQRAGLAGALLGAASFSGFFLAVVLVSPAGIGGGDVKLAVLLGTFVGYLGAPNLVLVGMFLSFLSGAIIGAIPALLAGGTRKTRMPFGPFLCLGTVLAIFVGQRLIDLYSDLLS